MEIYKSLKTACIIGMLALAPAFCTAAMRSCLANAVPSDSYTRYSEHANHQLKDIREDAQRVAYRAAVLKGLENGPEQPDWETYAHQLRRIKADVDDMGARLCRLESERNALPLGDRQAIRQAAPLVRYLADNTDDAINYLNAHKGDFFAPTYEKYTRNLAREAQALNRRIHRDEEV